MTERGEPVSNAFTLITSVAPGDIDELGHVNNTVYLRWVQEVATAHWQALASVEDQQSIAWVVVRHEIDYKIPAVSGDQILLRTWVGKATRLTFERFTEVLAQDDLRLFAKARTLWCPISTTTLKPTRVSAQLRAQFST
jgi:acyl-CoA thioester hydrolase